jgi:hypothetical protein
MGIFEIIAVLILWTAILDIASRAAYWVNPVEHPDTETEESFNQRQW